MKTKKALRIASPESINHNPFDSRIYFSYVGNFAPEALGVLHRGRTPVLAGMYLTSITEFDYSYLYNKDIIYSDANGGCKDTNLFQKIAEGFRITPEVEVFALVMANHGLQLLKDNKFRGAGIPSLT